MSTVGYLVHGASTEYSIPMSCSLPGSSKVVRALPESRLKEEKNKKHSVEDVKLILSLKNGEKLKEVK